MKCSYCHTPGQRFTAIIQDSKLLNVCVPCIKMGKRSPQPVPCHDYAPNGDDLGYRERVRSAAEHVRTQNREILNRLATK